MNSHHTSPICVAASLLGGLLLFATPAHADVPNEPPSVTITSPTDGQMFEGTGVTIDVVLETFPGDEGIDSVRLLVDDTPVLIDNDVPYGFEGVEFEEGMHTLVAVAVSAADGGEYPSAPVEIAVFGAPAEGDSTDSETSSSGGSTPEPNGCSTAGTQVGAALLLSFVFGLSFVDRRRRD
jgi:hypothetical protein